MSCPLQPIKNKIKKSCSKIEKKQECLKPKKDSEFFLTADGAKICLINNDHSVYRIRLDGCLIQEKIRDEKKRCDWLLLFKNNIYFIELTAGKKKPGDLASQFFDSFERFKSCISKLNIKYIYASRGITKLQKKSNAFKKALKKKDLINGGSNKTFHPLVITTGKKGFRYNIENLKKVKT